MQIAECAFRIVNPIKNHPIQLNPSNTPEKGSSAFLLFTPLEIENPLIDFSSIVYPFLILSIFRELKHLVRLNMLHNI
jgi:hypothetical protein